MHHRRRFPHDKLKVKEAFVREDPTISPTSEVIYDDFLALSDRIAKVSFHTKCRDQEKEMILLWILDLRSFLVIKGLAQFFHTWKASSLLELLLAWSYMPTAISFITLSICSSWVSGLYLSCTMLATRVVMDHQAESLGWTTCINWPWALLAEHQHSGGINGTLGWLAYLWFYFIRKRLKLLSNLKTTSNYFII